MTKNWFCIPIWGLFLAFAITALVQLATMSSGTYSGSHAKQVSSKSL